MLTLGLAVPSADPRQPVRDVYNLDIHGRGIEKVKTPAAQHTLPCAVRLLALP